MNLIKKSAALAALSVFTIASYAKSTDLLFYELMQNKNSALQLHKDSIKEAYYQQLIDHHTPALGQFAQRYFIDDSYAVDNNSPVFLYLCGEGTCSDTAVDGTVRDLAQQYQARLIALEHRYYGKSLPTATLSTNDLKYLTHENALADTADFIRNMREEHHWTGKWITFGGSYAGTLSAYMREKYPDLIAGAIASSAPVRVKDTFEEFDEHVTKIAGKQCAINMRQVVSEIEAAMNSDEKMAEIKAMFNASDIDDAKDFLSYVTDMGGSAIQYGFRDTFCDWLAASPTPIQGYAMFANLALESVNMTPLDFTPQGQLSENPADYNSKIGMRQWTYQVCTEFGSLDITNPDPEKSTSSQYLDLDYRKNICNRLFGFGYKADVNQLLSTYYQPLLTDSVSHIYFTNGSDDPWSRLSLIEENGNTTNKNLDYFLVEGGAHCDDLRAYSSNYSLNAARSKMSELIGKWL